MKHTEAEKLFLEKMAVLNKTFLYFIQRSLKEMPDADLSPSVLDYLKHVEELDRTYGNMHNEDGTSTSTDNEKKEIVDKLSKTSVSEEDAGDKAEREKDISVTCTSQEKPEFGGLTNVPKFSFGITTTSSAGSEKRGRKRAKKGGPEENDEEVIISNHNTPTSQHLTNSERCLIKTASSPISQLPEVSSFFNISTGNISKRSFDSRNDSKTTTESESSQKKSVDSVRETDTNKVPFFLFGQRDVLKENELLKNPQNFVPIKSFSEKGLAEKLDEQKELNEELIGKSHVTPSFSFLKPVVIEGNNGYSDSSKAGLDFSFGASPTVQSEPDPESEESEYVPPKPEAVLAEEPKAIFSSKCSVFVLKGTEYEKLGIGQLHIKTDETDEIKKILLIRAATTTGTVWVNSYVDKSMKHVIIDDVKLRISCVSNGTPSTYLLRLPKKEDRDQIVAEIQDDNISS